MSRLEKLEELLDDPKLIIDIGACDGQEIDWFLEKYPNAEVHAFEPDKRTYNILLSKYGNTPKVSLHGCAITQVEGKIPFYTSDSDTRKREGIEGWPASSSAKKPKEHLNVFGDIYFNDSEVKSMRFDNWNIQRLGDKIDLLWVDTNGGEKDVILSAGKAIEEKVKILCIEFCEVELYEGAANLEEIKRMLPSFEVAGTYDFYGNYGNCVMVNGNL
jgi:FkbM family methyltransferase